MATREFSEGEFYHVYNRGTEKRTTFTTHRDYRRFVNAMAVLNDQEPRDHLDRDIAKDSASESRSPQKPLVSIISYCLMPNHFHFLLRQEIEQGVTKFMQRLGTAYTMYFNAKYQRTGVLFQGVFKSIHVDHDAYLEHLSRYIHLNPLDLIEPQWKLRGVKNWKRAKEHLDPYPWSSYRECVEKISPSGIVATKLMRYHLGGPRQYEQFVTSWIPSELGRVDEYIIE